MSFLINRFFCLFLFVFILNTNSTFCQSLYGGEIYVENISGLTYKATVALSIDNSINTNNKPYVLLDWGDGTSFDTLRTTTISCGTVAYTTSYTSSTIPTSTSVSYTHLDVSKRQQEVIVLMPQHLEEELTVLY